MGTTDSRSDNATYCKSSSRQGPKVSGPPPGTQCEQRSRSWAQPSLRLTAPPSEPPCGVSGAQGPHAPVTDLPECPALRNQPQPNPWPGPPLGPPLTAHHRSPHSHLPGTAGPAEKGFPRSCVQDSDSPFYLLPLRNKESDAKGGSPRVLRRIVLKRSASPSPL